VSTGTIIFLAVIVVFLIYLIAIYNQLVALKNRFENAFARQAYNDSVMAYNTYRQSFPQILFAATFGHPFDAEMLEFEDREAIQEVPKVQF
jgi:LemA protein